jgi:hypothetical protein
VHVVGQVGHDERDGRQLRVVAREAGERLIGAGRDLIGAGALPVDPGVVLAGIVARRDRGRAGRGQAVGVAGERLAGPDQLGPEVRGRERRGGRRVGRDALGTPGEEGEIVGLARVGDPVRLGELRPLAGERVEVGGRGRAEDLDVGVVLLDDDDHMIGAGHGGEERAPVEGLDAGAEAFHGGNSEVGWEGAPSRKRSLLRPGEGGHCPLGNIHAIVKGLLRPGEEGLIGVQGGEPGLGRRVRLGVVLNPEEVEAFGAGGQTRGAAARERV